MDSALDLARIRHANALRLFEEFVAATVRQPDAAALRGLERRFAEKLDILPSYWSQIKASSRQIGERLARQFEQRCDKPVGWMDRAAGLPAPVATALAGDESAPRDDDERFIVALVLSYYRRHPARARGRLLDLLGEVLVPAAEAAPQAEARADAKRDAKRDAGPRPAVAETDLWRREAARIEPLKKRR